MKLSKRRVWFGTSPHNGFFSDRKIIITTGTEKIYGYGFESDYNFQNWELKKVTGRLKADRINNENLMN